PCGSGKAFAACCEPYLAGKAPAPTAEALMRARYASYATGRIDFVEKTHAPESRADFDREASQKWARESQWKGLEVVAVKGGAESDREGIVHFVARFAQGGRDYEHREIASFRKEGGAWFFVDGKSPKPDTFVKSAPDVGRNDPCSCGSGKKFKKCHGA
ncbi:MAG: YchJ family protein, partial [Elusimicrobia bacterium]|nr:YchJ family protein [Elusimicrobiota bacterium]